MNFQGGISLCSSTLLELNCCQIAKAFFNAFSYPLNRNIPKRHVNSLVSQNQEL